MKFNFISIAIVIIALLFTYGCRTESLSDENTIQTVQLKTDTTGTYKMKDVPIFKNYLQQKFIEENKNSQEYTNLLNDDQIVEVINKKDKISYSTLLEKGNSVFEYLIFTKKEDKEQLIIAELKSDKEISHLTLSTFTGFVSYKEINEKVIGKERFENGIPVKINSKSVCGWVTTAVSCAAGLHFPGESCAYAGKTGAAYYQTETIPCGSGNEHQEYINPDWGGGGGGNGTNPFLLSPPEALNHYLQNRGEASLTSQQINFLNNNSTIANELKYYFLVRDFNHQYIPTTFLHWSMNFFMQNSSNGISNVSWTQFQNWFMNPNGTPNLNLESWFITKTEGQDGEYIDNIDNVLSTINYQTRQMPTYSQYISNYPKLDYPGYPGYYQQMPASQVYTIVGNPLLQLYLDKGGDKPGSPYRNACTVRWSLAMNRLGILIPNNSESLRGADMNGQSRYYYIRATTANDAMVKIFGEPKHSNVLTGAAANDPKTVMDFLNGKTGIYVIVNADPNKAKYTGHVDIIQNGHVPGGSNHENVPGGIKSIKIWEFTP